MNARRPYDFASSIFIKGGWGDFGTAASGKSPLTPLCQRGERNQGTENCMTLARAKNGMRIYTRTSVKYCPFPPGGGRAPVKLAYA
jgi:hypothetical protein